MKTKRKKRTDCNYVIYRVTCLPTGQRYIGQTIAKGRAYKRSAKNRLGQHFATAKSGLDVTMAKAIRHFGRESFVVEVLEIVRGAKQADKRETELIKNLDPEFDLNDQSLRPRKHRLNDWANYRRRDSDAVCGLDLGTAQA